MSDILLFSSAFLPMLIISIIGFENLGKHAITICLFLIVYYFVFFAFLRLHNKIIELEKNSILKQSKNKAIDEIMLNLKLLDKKIYKIEKNLKK